MNDPQAQDGWSRRWDLIRACRTNQIYHRKRQGFLEFLDKSGKTVSLVTGAAAVAPFLESSGLRMAAGAAVVAASLASLALDWAGRARSHAAFAQKYTAIEADIHELPNDTPVDAYNAFDAKIVRLGVDEPPVMNTLMTLSSNDALSLEGWSRDAVKIGWLKRTLAQLFSGRVENTDRRHAQPG